MDLQGSNAIEVRFSKTRSLRDFSFFFFLFFYFFFLGYVREQTKTRLLVRHNFLINLFFFKKNNNVNLSKYFIPDWPHIFLVIFYVNYLKKKILKHTTLIGLNERDK
jgi:hypothetical protein